MKLMRITDHLTITGQLSEVEIAELSRAGTALLINNRPEGEEPGQLSSDAERRAAQRAGISYQHQPVIGADISQADVARFHEAVESVAGPVVAHCRSGTRCLILWVIGEVQAGRMKREEVLAFGAGHGVDLSAALLRLDQLPIAGH